MNDNKFHSIVYVYGKTKTEITKELAIHIRTIDHNLKVKNETNEYKAYELRSNSSYCTMYL